MEKTKSLPSRATAKREEEGLLSSPSKDLRNKFLEGIALILGVLAMSILVGYFVLAWTEPGSIPPVGNVPAPLNVSLNAQSKEGALVVGANSSVTTGLIVRYGNVGIGTTSPGEKLDIQGGNVKINTFRVKPVSATELGVYDSTNSLIVIFDEGN